jgi:hypothetical protein
MLQADTSTDSNYLKNTIGIPHAVLWSQYPKYQTLRQGYAWRTIYTKKQAGFGQGYAWLRAGVPCKQRINRSGLAWRMPG